MKKTANTTTPTPVVSVVCVTYNQEAFIAETLDSFLMQQVTFPMEIIVADDASTDKTPEIIAQYAQDHPDIIRPILRSKNIGVLANFLETMRSAKGRYIALCEGDDYWTDKNKLQKQVRFMDDHPDYSICFHPVEVLFDDGSQESSIYPDTTKETTFTVKRLLTNNFMQTNSVMYRRQDYSMEVEGVMPVDWYLHLYHAQFGKIGFIHDIMSVYRRHEGGIWWGALTDVDVFWEKYGLGHLVLHAEMLKMYGANKAYRPIIISSIVNAARRSIETDAKRHSTIIEDAIRTQPDLVNAFITAQHEQLIQTEQALAESKQNEARSVEHVNKLTNELARKQAVHEAEMHRLLRSRSFRTGYLLLHPWNIFK